MTVHRYRRFASAATAMAVISVAAIALSAAPAAAADWDYRCEWVGVSASGGGGLNCQPVRGNSRAQVLLYADGITEPVLRCASAAYSAGDRSVAAHECQVVRH